jgi:GAF domain-containing protein
MRSRLAWTLFGLTCLFAVAQITLIIWSDAPIISARNVSNGFPLVTFAAVAGAGIGALIVSRYPRHRIGWLLVVGQCGTAFGVAAQAYAFSALSGELGAAPLGHFAVWISVQTGAIFAITLLAVLFLLAPDGHLLSQRWRWMVGASLLGLLLNCIAVATIAPSRLDANGEFEGNEVFAGVLVLVGVVLAFVSLIGGAVSLVKRLRRAAGQERSQLRWVAAAAVGLAVGVFAAAVGGLVGLPDWLAVLPLMAAYVAVPILTGIAVLRFQLYDLDLIISRAIVLTVLSGLVAAGYVVLVVVISEVVDAPAEGTFWPSLLATVLVAIGVQPLRRRVSQLADRVVYGSRAAPYEALADFSKSLHESPATDDLLPRVAEAVGLSVGARHTQIWIEVPGRPVDKVCWPDRNDHPADVSMPVRDGDDLLGGLAVTMPPGRAVRPSELRLLQDFAVQLARAFRNIRLESELADRVDELAAQATELAASSKRLMSAQAAGRHRFESAINREVLPHLTGLPDQLTAMGTATSEGQPLDPDAISAMVVRTKEALEALRRLTRGVFPAQLAHRGLITALSSQLVLSGLSGVLRTDDDVAAMRFDARVESAAYFCAVEFLRELDSPDQVTLSAPDGILELMVSGQLTETLETRTKHLADRVAPLGGTLDVSLDGLRATMRVRIPVAADPSDGDLVPHLEHAAGVEG